MMERITHDKFVKTFMDNMRVVADFIDWAAPDIARRLDLTQIEHAETESVDDRFDRMFKDDVWGRSLYVYVIIEHKSRPDRFTTLQLLRYTVRVYQQKWQEYIKARKTDEDGNDEAENNGPYFLPPVLPIILYHGEREFSSPIEFSELVGAGPELEPYVPKFRVILIDMKACLPSQYPDPSEKVELYSMLATMQAVFEPDVAERLVNVMHHIAQQLRRPENLALAEKILMYSISRSEHLEPQYLTKISDELKSMGDETMGMTLADKLFAEGELKGKAEGKAEASQDSIIRILEARFGEVPASIGETVRTVTNTDRLEWLIATAATTKSLETFEKELSSL